MSVKQAMGLLWLSIIGVGLFGLLAACGWGIAQSSGWPEWAAPLMAAAVPVGTVLFMLSIPLALAAMDSDT